MDSGRVHLTNLKPLTALFKSSYRILRKNCSFCFFLLIFTSDVFAQGKNPPPAQYHDIFSDLPINDAASLSVLKKNENPELKIRKYIFIKSRVSKSVCYVGEPILLSYELYSALQNESEVAKLPSFAGAGMIELSVLNELPVYSKINGLNYRVFNLRQFQLIPNLPGKLFIDTISVANIVHYKIGADSTGHYEGMVNSGTMVIEVKPLPESGKPVDFSGAVGNFQLDVSVDSDRVAAGETNALHIAISGSGNFTPLSMPEINWPSGFDYFPEREKLTMVKNNFPPLGREIFDIPFVPKKAGRYFIPGLKIEFFNAIKGHYDKSRSDSIKIIVLAAKPSVQVEQEPDNKTPGHLIALWIGLAIALAAMVCLVIFMKKKRHH